MNTPLRPGLTTCVQVTSPDPQQSESKNLHEAPVEIKRETPFSISSELETPRWMVRPLMLRLYEEHAASTLSDFIQTASTMKGAKTVRKKGKKNEPAGPVFVTSDQLRTAAANITAEDLQGWGVDCKYLKLLRNMDRASIFLPLLPWIFKPNAFRVGHVPKKEHYPPVPPTVCVITVERVSK